MGAYTDMWSRRQMLPDPERFTRHQPPHSAQVGFSVVELQATAPQGELDGTVVTDAVTIQGSPASPIDRTPSLGGRGRDWNRGRSEAGGQGVVARTGYTPPGGDRVPFGTVACADVSAAQYRARSVDAGAGTLATKAFMPHGPHGQMVDEQRSTVLKTGLSTTPMANQGAGWEVLRRGLNADPVNDGAAMGGPGVEPRPTAWRVGEDDSSLWRPARYLSTPIDRDFRPTRQLPTDQVAINPIHTPQIIVTAPPPRVPSKGGDLLSSLSRFLPRQVPVGPLPRTPGPWYEPAEAAATETDLSQLPDYSGTVYA